MILLVDTDSKIPNIALMKLSTHYKGNVELLKLNYNGYPYTKKVYKKDLSIYDKVYVSTIFTNNSNVLNIKGNIEYGGTGISFNTLPDEIDNLEEDYSIYPDSKISYGFITRGCNRNCSFCFVPKKEGTLKFYRHPKQIIRHKIVEFLDNNILAYEDHIKILEWLVNNKIRYNFNQGLDIRLITDENTYLLNKSNYKGEYIFAFDHINYEKIINEKLKIVKKYINKDWRIKMFILVGFNSTIEEDIYRIEWCRKNKILPYIMRYENCWKGEYKSFYANLTAYCNQPYMFKTNTPSEFIGKRNVTEKRKKEFIELYK